MQESFQAFQEGAGGHSGKYAVDVSVIVLGIHRPWPYFYTAGVLLSSLAVCAKQVMNAPLF